MKQLILLLLFFPLFSLGQIDISYFADQQDRVAIDVPGPKNTHQILGLNGNVKSIKVTFYNATEKFGKPEKEDFLKYYEIKFDIEGNASEYRYKQFDSLNFEYKYKYDNVGNLIEEIEDDEFRSKKYIYDKNGYNTEIYQYSSDDHLSRVYKMEYNKFGNILVKTRYTPDGVFIDSYKYFYSDNGKTLLRTLKRGWRKRIEKQITYSYDKSNQYNMKYLCIWNEFSGDVNDDLLPMSECAITESKQYDYEGKLIKWTRFPNTPNNTEMLTQEELFYYDYKNYDKKNNWTLKINVENDWVKAIVEREIEYYD